MLLLSQPTVDYNHYSDEELLTASLKHPSLYTHLIDRYEEAFRRKARAIVGYREEVEDILQETFTRIYLRGNQYHPQPGASFSSWAYMILSNVSFTYYQKLKRRGETQVVLDQEVVELLPQMAHDEQAAHITEEYVISVLVRMPVLLARVLRLHFLEDRSQQDIADELGISVSAVKARIFRAKKWFKKIDYELAVARIHS
jgi:RNA polymerase sigma-70 factor, ECF subfamily